MASTSTRTAPVLTGTARHSILGDATVLESRPAVPITRDLLYSYGAFLLMERRILAHELFPEGGWVRDFFLDHNGTTKAVERFYFPLGQRWDERPMPSTRAVAILNAAGVPI
jgi:hypothetical protein